MKEKLRKIVDYLLLRSPYMQDIGLFHGKMGVVVALYLYAAKYHDELISEYAWDLLQQIYDGVYSNMPVGLEYGLAGIGYGTTILYKRGLVDCDLKSILTDVVRSKADGESVNPYRCRRIRAIHRFASKHRRTAQDI